MLIARMPAIITDVFASLILLVLLVSVKQRQTRFTSYDQQLFVWMLETNLALLLLDTGTMLLDGQAFAGARALNLFCTAGYYALDPLMSYLYIQYCDIKMGVPYEARVRVKWLYLLPLAVNLVLTLISLFHPILFSLSMQNVYSRAPYLALSFVLSTVLLPVALVKVMRHILQLRRQYRQDQGAANAHSLATLIWFPIVPFLGVIAQIWFNQITVVWLSTVIALLIIFISIQNLDIATDSLTGLFNRRQTDAYLQNLFLPSSRVQSFTVMMLDMDHFKQINDRHGHVIGDRVLRALGSILRAECEADEFIGRYGGDEFIIITTHSGEERLQNLISRINQNLSYYGKAHQLSYPLAISIGYAERSPEMRSMDELVTLADAALYQQKSHLRRRVGDR